MPNILHIKRLKVLRVAIREVCRTFFHENCAESVVCFPCTQYIYIRTPTCRHVDECDSRFACNSLKLASCKRHSIENVHLVSRYFPLNGFNSLFTNAHFTQQQF